jgi:hypothetical protein
MVAFPLQLRAVFREGKLVPQEPCTLPEAAEVQLTIEPSNVTPPLIADPAEKLTAVQQAVLRMMSQPLAQDAAKISRDELHERR